MSSKESLKKVIHALVRDNASEAQKNLHDYLVSKLNQMHNEKMTAEKQPVKHSSKGYSA